MGAVLSSGGEALKIGILGYGSQGQKYRDLILEANHTPLIHDPNISESLPLDHVFEDCDCMVIAAPTTAHFELANRCLCEGIPVLVEKPFTSTLSEAKKLVSVAEDSGTPLMVNHNERFHPMIQEISKYRPFSGRVMARRDTQRPGSDSLVQRLMVHDIDLCNWLYEGLPVKIDVTEHDAVTTVAKLEYVNGEALLCASYSAPRRVMGIFGPKVSTQIDFTSFKYSLNESLNHFINNVKFDKPFNITAEDGMWAVQVMAEIELQSLNMDAGRATPIE